MNFLLTLDYELFGNGSGDVFHDIIEPTEKLLAVARKYGVKFTVFFEVVEYWKLKEEWEKGNNMGYASNPVLAMESQIIQMAQEGHDIQLHIHPQWVDAKFEDGSWRVNLEEWRLSSFRGGKKEKIEELLLKGKNTLEQLLQPVAPSYSCVALRAGGYNAQPSETIVKAIKTVGLKADLSVYPGGYETGTLSNYDYRGIDPALSLWYVRNKLEEPANEGEIIEIPIVAYPMRRYSKFLTLSRIKKLISHFGNARQSLGAKTQNHPTSPRESRIKRLLRYFIGWEAQTWDFCLFSKSQHRKFLQTVKDSNRSVVVLVGHPKSLVSTKPLEYLLDRLVNEKSLTCNQVVNAKLD